MSIADNRSRLGCTEYFSLILLVLLLPQLAYAGFTDANGKIAFTSNRDGNDEIYVMNANGSNPLNLTNNAAKDDNAAWSPDGKRIAFTSNRDGNDEIYVMNADGSGQVRITNNSVDDFDPTWSFDGSRIAFTSNRVAFNEEIFIMNADGSNQIRLTFNNAADREPAWGWPASNSNSDFTYNVWYTISTGAVT